MRSIKAFVLSLILAATSLNTLHAGLAVRLFYPGYGGNSISSFKPFVPDFPYNFDPSPYFSLNGEGPEFTFFTNLFDSGTPIIGGSVGSFFHGYIDAPQTGSYVFYIASDDDSTMYLSTDSSTNNLSRNPICQNIGAVGYLSWNSKPSQKSAPINLVKGRRYYYEVNHKQGGGGAHISVGWQLPDGSFDRPMNTIYVQPYEEDFANGSSRTNAITYTNPTFATQAANGGNLGPLTLTESTSGSLSVAVRGRHPMAFQWYRAGVALAGATNSFLTITNAKSLTNGLYRVTVSNSFGLISSFNASVTVTPDTVKPSLVSANVYGRSNAVTLAFSEPVSATALNIANYTFVTTNSSVSVSATAVSFVGSDPTRVNVTVSDSFDVTANYYVSASNITDLAAVPNTITTNSVQLIIVSQDNLINYARFDNIGNTDVPSLTNNSAFINWNNSGRVAGATVQQKINVTSLDTTGNRGGNVDNYGAIMWGYLIPPVNGDYRFYLVADDNSSLYLSTDSSPANKIFIAQVPSWGNWQQWISDLAGGNNRGINGFTNYFDYDTGGNHTYWSRPITLQAGKPYYFEAYQKEGGGGDDFGFTWGGPAGSGIPTVANGSPGISAAYLATILSSSGQPVTITNAALPADLTVADFKPATFRVQADGAPQIGYQWYRSNSVAAAFLPIGDAQLATYTLPLATLAADNQAYFYCIVSNGFSYATSRVAQLTVIADTVPPTVLRASGHGFFTNATVRFSEAMDFTTASTATNYSIVDANNTPLSIIRATLDSTLTNVILNTGPQTPGMVYTISINTNLLDASSSSNSIAVATNVSFQAFVLTRGFLAREFYLGVGGNSVSDLQSYANYPDFPDRLDYLPNGFNSPQTGPNLDNFGARLTGVLSVPTNTALVPSGLFFFYLQSDDASAVYIGPDASPTSFANSTQSTNAGFEVAGANSEVVALYGLPLARGNSYFIQGLYKEGGGGDYMRVAWRDQADGNSLAGTNNTFVIPATYLSAYADPFAAGVTITSQPSNIGPLPEGVATNISVTAKGTNFNNANPPISYIWQTAPPGTFGNNGFADIDGQGKNANSYQTPLLFGGDLGRRYRCLVSVPGMTVTSAVSTVTNIIANTTPLQVVKAVGADGGNPSQVNTATTFGLNGLTNIVISFDRLIDPNSVLPSQFAVTLTNGTGALSVFSARVVNGTNVVLNTSQQVEGGFYKVTVSPGITDQNANHNTVAPGGVVQNFTGWIFSTGAITFNRYTGIGGGNVSDLIGNAKFPSQPNFTQFLSNWETNGSNPNIDNFGDWSYGYFIPPTNGLYVFALSGDDGCELWLSTDSLPSHRVLIATESQWNGFRNWSTGDRRGIVNGHLENQSDAFNLIGGNKYYMEFFHKEGGGGDPSTVGFGNDTNFSTVNAGGRSLFGYACFTNNSGPITSPSTQGGTINGSFMGLYANPDASKVTISAQPANTTVREATAVTFSVTAVGQNYYTLNAGAGMASTAPLYYQWTRNGTNIPNATAASYTFVNTLANSNDTYRCIVMMTNVYAVTNFTTNFTLTVTPDTRPLQLLSAVGNDGGNPKTSASFGLNGLTNILISFDRILDPATVVPGQFTVTLTNGTGALTVFTATLVNGTNVLLTTSQQVEGGQYMVTVGSGVTDLTANRNSVPPGSNVKNFTGWVFSTGAITFNRYFNIGGGNVSDLTNNSKFPNSPDVTQFLANWETNGTAPNIDNFGDWSYGYFIPPTNGVYVFALSGDDGCQLWLSTDSTPSQRVRIATESQWNGFRNWNTSDRRATVNGHLESQSDPITLVGGNKYYMEFFHKEGGGGDPSGVAVGNNTNKSTTASPLGYAAFENNLGPSTTVPGGTIPGAFVGLYANPDVSKVTITSQPANTTSGDGNAVTFTVNATGQNYFTLNAGAGTPGTAPLSYQWLRNGTNIPGATASTYTFTSTLANNGDTYQALVMMTSVYAVTNATTNVTLTVVTPVAITQQPTPSSITTNVGANVSYTMTATGPSLTYQWYFNVTNSLAGANTSTLTLNNVQKANAGGYTVVVSNPGGSVTSSPPATLSVLVTPYSFTNSSRVSGSAYSVQFKTDAGRNYLVQYTAALSTTPPTSWTTLTNIVGTGGLVTVNDVTASGVQRFYRVSTTYP